MKCNKCKQKQLSMYLRDMCYSCFQEYKKEDMNKLEEYLQGDHGHVISPSY